MGWKPTSGTDADAIHDNVASEISAITEKASPVGADLLVIEDSAAANAKKRVQITNLPGGADADAIHDNVAAEISAVTEKVIPVSADLVIIEDSAAANVKKRVQVGNLPGGGGAVPEWISYLAERQDDETPHADDDLFGSDSSADYTEQTVTGTGLWTIGRGVLSSVFDSQVSGDLSAYLKSITSASAPMTIETRLTVHNPTQDFISAGLFFSDGTATSSKSVGLVTVGSDGNFQAGAISIVRGTLTDFHNAGTVMSPTNAGLNSALLNIYLRVVWTAANTWQRSISWDSNAWYSQGASDVSYTMTPTHFGFGVSTRGHASEWAATFDYLRVYDSDLSV